MSQEQEPFVKTFLAIHRQLYAYVTALTPSLHDADEVFQKTSLTLWEKWREFDPSRPFFPWACGVARIQARKHLSSKGRLEESLDDETACVVAAAQEQLGPILDVRVDALRECLQRLTEKQRALLSRCYARETRIPLQEIAEKMGITTNSLYQQLKRLRENLHACIDRVVMVERR